MKSIGTAFVAVACSMFVAFTIIHMSIVNTKMDEWAETYKTIEEDVSAFIKVSDPETIRHYVKELNKILDDITFLGKIVESGQLADESLTSILDEQVLIDKRLKYISTHTDSVFKRHNAWIRTSHSSIADLEVDVVNLEVDLSEMDSLILKKIYIIKTDLDTIRALIKDIDDSKINKFW